MMGSLFVLVYAICVALATVQGNPVDGPVSFVDSLNFQYDNGKWICGDVKCPAEATGCHLRIKSDNDDKKVVYQSFNCVDSLGAGDRIELTKERLVDIDISTYAGAKSAYSISYNNQGKESARGVVAVDELEELKEKHKGLKEEIKKKNSGNAEFSKGM